MVSDDEESFLFSDVYRHSASKTPRGRRKEEQKFRFAVQLSKMLLDRFTRFFGHYGSNKTNSEKLEILLALAETHPDVVGDGGDGGTAASALCSDFAASGLPSTKRKRRPGPSAAGDAEEPLFFIREIDDEVRNHQLTIVSEPSEQATSAATGVECGWESWDDEDEADSTSRVSSDLKPFQALSTNGSMKWHAPHLLSKDYYTEFSRSARNHHVSPLDNNSISVAKAANRKRVIVEVSQLYQLLVRMQCEVRGCGSLLKRSSVKLKFECYTVKVEALCEGPLHVNCWASSVKMQHQSKPRSTVYATDVAAAAAIIVSGSNYSNIEHFFKALHIQCGSESHFWRIQRGCGVPAVEKASALCQAEMFARLQNVGPRLILAGDGQFDSPGSCAKHCTYTLIAAGIEKEKEGECQYFESGYILSQAVVDRRHVDNKSPNAEHAGLHVAMRPIIDAGVRVSELITDENSMVVADFKKVAAAIQEIVSNQKNPRRPEKTNNLDAFAERVSSVLAPCTMEQVPKVIDFYAGVHHSIDLWHKAKNIMYAVRRISQLAPDEQRADGVNERAIYLQRATHLKNHLWHCSEVACKDPQIFETWWMQCLNHLAGDHEHCMHNSDEENDRTPPLMRGTKAFEELTRYVHRVAGLADHLCRFRHTGALESFHALSLAYGSKRNDFSYDIMVMRKQLAALDHNHHLRLDLKTRDGAPAYTHEYSKASKSYSPKFWKAKATVLHIGMYSNVHKRQHGRSGPSLLMSERSPLSEANKDYEYMGHLVAATVDERITNNYDFEGGNAPFSEGDPRHLQPSLAPYSQEPEKTYEEWRSRFPATRTQLEPPESASNAVNDAYSEFDIDSLVIPDTLL